MMNSKQGVNFVESLRHLGEDAQMSHWAMGFDQDGYAEWIKNEDAAMLFEDVYAIKEAFKALITSKMAMENKKLGMKAI